MNFSNAASSLQKIPSPTVIIILAVYPLNGNQFAYLPPIMNFKYVIGFYSESIITFLVPSTDLKNPTAYLAT
jgi:hypothetical protein